jgi:hypothetical protein
LRSSVRYLSALCIAWVTDAFEPANITYNTLNQQDTKWKFKRNAVQYEDDKRIILTGLVMSRSCTSSVMRLVDRRTGNLERVSLREILVICCSSFLFSQRNKATSTTIPAVGWFKRLVIFNKAGKKLFQQMSRLWNSEKMNNN